MEVNVKNISALLDHLVHHNEHHNEELEELAKSTKKIGSEEAANLINEGVEFLAKSNAKLREALEKLGK